MNGVEKVEVNGFEEGNHKTFKSQKSASWLLQKLNKDRYSDPSSCDVVLCADDMKVNAHRCILSCYSDFFKSMFSIEMREKYEKNIKIGVKGSSLVPIIDYMYTENITLTEDNVVDVLVASHYMEMFDVFDLCSTYLNDHISSKNCLSVIEIGMNYNLKLPVRNATILVLKNVMPISTGQFDLSTLEKAALENILRMNKSDLKLYSDELVFEIIMTWTKGDTEKRKEFLPDMLSFLDLHSLPITVLQMLIATDKLIMESPTCMKIVMDAVFNCAMKPKEDFEDTEEIITSKFLAIGGLPSYKTAVVFNTKVKNWKSLRPSTIDSHFSTATLINENVFLIGGFAEGGRVSDCVEKLDLKTPKSCWKTMASMKKERVHAKSALYRGGIVVVGGMDDLDLTLSCGEVYNAKLDTWTALPCSLNVARQSFGLCNFQGSLHAIGGNNGEKDLNSVEKYNEELNCWQFVSFLNQPRSELACVVLGKSIYAIGGCNGKQPLATVERYDFTVNKWREVAPMHYARQHPNACVLGGKIYVIGGGILKNDGEVTVINTIEVYDETNDQWQNFYIMRLPKFGSVVVPY